MITSGSEEIDVAVRSFKATTRTAAKAGSQFFYISLETAKHVIRWGNHWERHAAQYSDGLTDQHFRDALARQWVRDNPGKARAELAKVEASR